MDADGKIPIIWMKFFTMQSATEFLHVTLSKTNQGLRALSYTGPSLWNNQDKSLKTSASLNSFKHNIKDYYFRKGHKKEP